MDTETHLSIAAGAARAAGEVIRSYFGKDSKRYSKGKGKNDFATEADIHSERLIIQHLEERFPNDNIVAEESRPIAPSSRGGTWIIDPLDGTYNFTQGIKNCGVMIAFANGLHVQIAVLFNPFKNIMVTAQRGRGVFVGNERKRLGRYAKELRPIADKNGFAPVLRKTGLEGSDLWSSIDNALLVLIGEKNAYLNKTAKVWDLAPLSLCFEEYGLHTAHADQKPYRWHTKPQTLIAVPPDLISHVERMIAGE